MLPTGDLEVLRHVHLGGAKGTVGLREADPFRGPPLHTAHETPEFK